MTAFLGELIGTAMLMLMGNGVVANCLLPETKGHGGGWLIITLGWAIAVFIAVFIVAPYSGAHINPAVTVGLAVAGKFAWAQVPAYLAAQFIGAFLGGFVVWFQHKQHYDLAEDRDAILGTFCTGPAINHPLMNFISELVGTFVLVFAVLYLTGPVLGGEEGSLGSLDALPVALVVLGIGLSLGGTTGYAINPARDLSPRILHALLPIPGKGGSNWVYSWVPVIGPLAGGILAGVLFLGLQ